MACLLFLSLFFFLSQWMHLLKDQHILEHIIYGQWGMSEEANSKKGCFLSYIHFLLLIQIGFPQSNFVLFFSVKTNKQTVAENERRNGDIPASFTDIMLRSACQACGTRKQRQIHSKGKCKGHMWNFQSYQEQKTYPELQSHFCFNSEQGKTNFLRHFMWWTWMC